MTVEQAELLIMVGRDEQEYVAKLQAHATVELLTELLVAAGLVNRR